MMIGNTKWFKHNITTWGIRGSKCVINRVVGRPPRRKRHDQIYQKYRRGLDWDPDVDNFYGEGFGHDQWICMKIIN